MRRSRWFVFFPVYFLAVAARADVSSEVQSVLRDDLLKKATVGIEIVKLGRAHARVDELYQLNAHRPMTPASNLKLTTTSAAMDRLGPDFKFQTTLLLHDKNDVVLVGDGDPSFGDSEYLKRVGWKCTTVFEHWAAQLKKMNVASVRDVIIDDSIFDDVFLHARWPANQIDHWYVAQVGGLNFNQNCIEFMIRPTAHGARVEYSLDPNTRYVTVDNSCVTGRNNIQLGRKPGSNEIILKGEAPAGAASQQVETIDDPGMYGATVLAETLEAAGVKRSGTVKRQRGAAAHRQKDPGWSVIGVHETPLAVVLARANKDSINLYAESLCKRLGREASHESGSWSSGTAAVGAFLLHAGVPAAEFQLDDGSGLSKQNAISPHALVQVLQYDFYGKNREAMLSSLSVAGVDGTLEDRFRGSDLRHRIIGKSGFVEGVSCLSGFLKAKDDQWYAFSIMMNGIPYKSNTGIKALQERILRALDAQVSPVAAAPK